MTNLEVLKGTCNAICNTFYPDDMTMRTVLFNNGIEVDAEAKPKDVELLKVAITLVNGFVESSRSEGGVSTSNFEKAIQRNIAIWCSKYGLDASEYISSMVVVKNGSNRW